MKSGRRILFVTEKFPWPVDDGGQIRTYNVLKNLARELPVTLIALAPPRPEDVEPIRELGVEVKVVGQRRARWLAPLYAAGAVVTRAPYPMRKNFSRAMLETIQSEIASGMVSVLHFNHLDAAQYVEHLGTARSQVRCVFDTHNVLTKMYERFRETETNPVKRLYFGQQWMKMHRFERAIMRAMDKVCVCSDLERELLHRFGIDKVIVVPNGVDTEYFAPGEKPAKKAGEAPVLVFTGALDYLPNSDGVRWFIEQVIPALKPLLPRFKFLVVGKNPPASLTALARPGEIDLTGRVDDVRPFMRQADVCAVPIRIGGGTRLKAIEALSMELPVVSTKVGAEGLPLESGRDLLIADEPSEMARSLAELCSSPEKARALAISGRAIILERFDWKNIVARLADEYRA